MTTIKDIMAESNNGQETPLIEKWAIWIVGICFVMLLLGVGCFVFNKTVLMPKVAKLEIKVIPDSLSTEATYSKREVDSLITLTKQTLDSYQHHFKTEIVQKEQEDVYKSFGALLLSVIVGLCGFFGFKSFKDIKEKGEQTAKDAATKIAEGVAEIAAKKTAEAYLESKLPEVVDKQFEKSFKETTVNSIKESVKTEVIPQIIQALQNNGADDAEGEPQGGEVPNENASVAPMSPEEMFDKQPQND